MRVKKARIFEQLYDERKIFFSLYNNKYGRTSKRRTRLGAAQPARRNSSRVRGAVPAIPPRPLLWLYNCPLSSCSGVSSKLKWRIVVKRAEFRNPPIVKRLRV